MSIHKVLVVEDDNDSRTALCTILESLGYEPLAFSGAKQALQAMQKEKVDIALLDIMMPEMNGYELMDALRQLPEFESTPIIMVTAKDQDSEIIEGYKSGADYYIPKPFNAQQIKYGLELFLNSEGKKGS